MKKYSSTVLLDQLRSDVLSLMRSAETFMTEDPAYLLAQPAPGEWSVVQVMEHLNSYGHYYIPAIERSLRQNKPASEYFIPGWIGDKFTKMMQPTAEGKVKNKMKAPKGHRPVPALDHKTVILEFLTQQHALLSLLDQAKTKNIGSIRTPISLTRLIRLKVGDTFRFLIAHEQRHFVQAYNTLAIVKKGVPAFSMAFN